MTPGVWRQIEELYQAARDLPPSERIALLDRSDPEMRATVLAILAQEDASRKDGASSEDDGAFLDRPAWEGQASWLKTDTMVVVGQRLGPYEILAPLGAGGMGDVYKARDTRLDRTVAIKVSKTEFSERFEREARAISALNHPHICTLYDVGSLPSGAGYMVTELVEGETLCEWLKNPHSAEQSLGVTRQVLEALRAAHSAGIVHRDLKPANIMVRADGYVKVLDFGVAKRISATGGPCLDEKATVSVPGQIIGTLAYMSPEQILCQEVDARCDLFAVGVILYEMLNGRHPWRRESTVDLLHAILHEDPPPAEGRWAPIVRKLLSKNREDRYSSAQALLDALSQPASAPPTWRPP